MWENQIKSGDQPSPFAVEAKKIRKWLKPVIITTFIWTIFGVCGIYGYRMWQDAPIHPSFIPMIYGCVSILMALVIVLTLEQVVGEIEIEVSGLKLKGASGPIVLWILCLLAISFTFKMSSDLKESGKNWIRLQTHSAHNNPRLTRTIILDREPGFTPYRVEGDPAENKK